MQNTPVYLVNQRTDIISNESGFVTEFRKVYEKQLKVYKGIDNTLQFRLLNSDQKPQDVSGLTPYFVAYDENRATVIERIGVNGQQAPCDSSSSTAIKNKGLFEVVLSAQDLQNLDCQFLSYSIYFKNAQNETVLTYVDAHFGGTNVIKLLDTIYPDPRPTTEVTQFTEQLIFGDSTESWYSESAYAKPETNNNEALHTAAFYTQGYASDIIIQATLENQVTDTTEWTDVKIISFDGSTTPVHTNFYGVYTYIRFVAKADPEDITKILVRN